MITDKVEGKGLGRNWRNAKDTESFKAKTSNHIGYDGVNYLSVNSLIILLTSY